MLFLSVHALQQMAGRDISRDEILQALTGRETVYVSDEDPTATVILGHTQLGRRLKVVVSTDDQEYVITVAARDEEG